MKKLSKQFKTSIISSALLPALAIYTFSEASDYQVKSGDSLSKIANLKYGDWFKWKNLWQANQKQIKNPDLIYPGQRLTLLNGEELSLAPEPKMSSASTSTEDSKKSSIKKYSQEWRLLPTQPWEKFVFKLDPTVDQYGFDKRSRVAVRIADKTIAEITIASDRIPILGEIENARTEFERVFLGETVFIRADEPLQVGTIYSITTGPQKIRSKRDGRVGFAYDLTGKVRIVGVRDGVFIGTITALYHAIERHQLLIPVINAYEFPEPVASKTPIEASVVVSKNYQDDLLGEQKVVFLDVGKEDGVRAGNIFRHYLHNDPNTNAEITSKDFMIESELLVLNVQDKFSIAVILKGRNAIRFGDLAVALTDLADLDNHQGLQSILQEHDQVNNIDELDQLDQSEGLGDQENHDLRQLENWSKPSPSAPLQPETANEVEDIQKVDVHEHPKKTVEVGEETAPNDQKPELNPTPDATPAPPPEEIPEPTNAETTVPSQAPSNASEAPTTPEATPAATSPETQMESTTSSPSTPPPVEEKPMSPTPPANGTPSGTDPFTIPEEPPVTP